MSLSEVLQRIGEQEFARLLSAVSIGKLRTYQLYDAIKAHAGLNKVNTETLRRAIPVLWRRVAEGDEAVARDVAQAILLPHLDMIAGILDFLGIPHRAGFFEKGLDASPYLTPGWQQRVYDRFKQTYPASVLVFYINHLAAELDPSATYFEPL